MERATVKDITRLTGVHGNTIRAWSDKGIIEAKKDFRGWRFFPDPAATAERIKGLLNGDIQLEE